VNAKLWLCVLMGVLVAHIAVIFIVGNIRTSGKPPPKSPEPNFETRTRIFTNTEGKTMKIVHEFTVETELAPPSVLEKLPRPPTSDASRTAAPAAAN